MGTIQVRADAVLDDIDPRIYGQNIEHMGRQVLGGIVAEPGSVAPRDDRGFRRDVRESILDLRPSLLRWPGGCFADSYHGKDGVGPHRPTVPNRMWGRWLIGKIFGSPPLPLGPLEDNRFGTDEFMELCREGGAEPSLTASLGADDPGEAADWVAYVREHYGAGAVPTWSVGNEQWNIIEPNGCANRPERYVDRFHRFAGAMRAADPQIRLVASGGDALTLPQWNEEVIRGIGTAMDFYSMHPLVPAWVLVARSRLAGRVWRHRRIGIVSGGADTADRGDGGTAHRPRLADAGILHAFHRQARYVKTAAMFAMVSAAAPPILTSRDTIVRTPIHHVLRMHRQLTGKSRVRTEPDCPTVDVPALLNLHPRKAVPLLDVSATRDENRLTIFVVNREANDHQEARVEIEGFSSVHKARVHRIAAAGYAAENTVAKPDKGSLRFPPCSVTAIVLEA